MSKSAKRFLSNNNVVLILLFIALYGSFFVNYFVTQQNITNIIVNVSVYGIICIGMTFVLLTGAVDLSLGYQVALAAIVSVAISNATNPFLGAICAVVVCAMVGLINGLLVTKLKLNALIVTIAMMRILYGLCLFLCNDKQIANTNPEFLNIFGAKLFGVVPVTIIYFTICFFVVAFLLKKTPFGTSIYVVGGNAEAGHMSGINVDRVRTLGFVIASIFAALGGIIIASRVGMGSSTLGEGLTLSCISSCVIGGIKITGGKGSVWHTLLGTLTIQTIINIMTLKVLSGWTQTFVTGAVLVVVLIIDVLSKSKKSLY